ncbi:hypothetical protein MN116_001864 [Schistosoma mekongi]|uniref:Uncharacterized protein n=1 Tax=Schistosoma mekongi TaxID=38744 RepID=A0AAE1ZJQ2_SCHME|nr:hypothetical protein MN116_001864 [Schistosoma mekongi]
MAAVQEKVAALSSPSKKSVEMCRKDLEAINIELEASIREIEKSLVSMEQKFSANNILLTENFTLKLLNSIIVKLFFLKQRLLAEMDNDLERLEADISKLIKHSDFQAND